MAENFPNLSKNNNLHVPRRSIHSKYTIISKISTNLGIIIKRLNVKDKGKFLKVARKKKINVAYKGAPIRFTFEFSSEILGATKQWENLLSAQTKPTKTKTKTKT